MMGVVIKLLLGGDCKPLIITSKQLLHTRLNVIILNLNCENQVPLVNELMYIVEFQNIH